MLRRALPWLLFDAAAVLALAFPGVLPVRWILLAAYVQMSYVFLRQCSEQRWILRIVKDRHTRVAHGLEHATLAVLAEDGLPVVHGFTLAPNHYVVALEGRSEHEVEKVRAAAESAVRRVGAGERELCYQPGCGTSELVTTFTFWLVMVMSGYASRALGASSEVTFALTIMLGHLWYALAQPLGLLAQRLFTVDTNFSSARITDVQVVSPRSSALAASETWFAVRTDIRLAAEGGLVIPGVG